MEDKNFQNQPKVNQESGQKNIWKTVGIFALSLALAVLTVLALNI